MEKNPQVRHALSDPAVLKDLLSMATNKTAYSELMRGHDRQLSNLENIPQGFQQLQRLYQDMDVPRPSKIPPSANQFSAMARFFRLDAEQTDHDGSHAESLEKSTDSSPLLTSRSMASTSPQTSTI